MMSLDGYFEGLNKEIDWHNVDADFNDFAIEQLNNASFLVFGRITYELMANYWSSDSAIKDEPLVAGKMNSIPKIVFSKSLLKADWENTQLVKGDVQAMLRTLRKKAEKDIFIFGSADLATSLITQDLIDEYRIMINPVILGQGNTLFKNLPERKKLTLIRSMTFRSGNVLLFYKAN